jgi:carboxyl-terminal processing protease
MNRFDEPASAGLPGASTSPPAGSPEPPTPPPGSPPPPPAWQPSPPGWQSYPQAWQPVPAGWPPAPPRRSRGLVRGIAALLAIVIVAAGGFLAGVGYERGGLTGGSAGQGAAPPADARSQVGLLYQAWNLVEQHYVDRAALDPTQLTYGAIRGLVQALGDTGHTDFLTPQEAAALSSDLSGQYQGIGVEISIKAAGPSIVSVFDGSPAQKAGLRAGDLILTVNGQDVTADSFDTLASKLRGPAGSTVRVRVLDPGATSSREVTVTREPIVVPNVTWAMLPGSHVADVRLEQFAQNAAKQLTTALKAARTSGATAIILDLRGDPGGYVSEAVGAASQFLPAGDVVFIQRDASGKETTSKAQPGGVATTMPLVALVDDGTASAAEILAGALQDNGRATIVGVKTFGTGTVLESFKLSDGSEVRIGVAEWLTPHGNQIWHKGIQPDDVVTLPSTASPVAPSTLAHMTAAQLAASGDTQLLRGLALLSKRP